MLQFSHHVVPPLGVDHLIVLIFETNQPISRIQFRFACRFLHFSMPLPPFFILTRKSRSCSNFPRTRVIVFTSRRCSKNDGSEKIWKSWDSNRRPMEWQSSVLTNRPRHSPVCLMLVILKQLFAQRKVLRKINYKRCVYFTLWLFYANIISIIGQKMRKIAIFTLFQPDPTF